MPKPKVQPDVQVPSGEEVGPIYTDVRPYMKDEKDRKMVSKYHLTPFGYGRLGTGPSMVKRRVTPSATDALLLSGEGESIKDTISHLPETSTLISAERQLAKDWSNRENVSIEDGEAIFSPVARMALGNIAGDVTHAYANHMHPERTLSNEATSSVARARRRKAALNGKLPIHKYPIRMFKDQFMDGTSHKKNNKGGYSGYVKDIE